MRIANEFGIIDYYENDYFMLECHQRQIFFEQEYVVKYLSKFIRRSHVVCDVGAHAGSHTLLYKYLNRDLIVYSFEPQENMYKLLKSNIKLNGYKNIYPRQMLVGEKDGFGFLSTYSTDGPNSWKEIEYGGQSPYNLGGLQVAETGTQVPMTKLDSILENPRRCDFIKMDAEGYELNVILGAIQTIRAWKPVISFELNHKSPESSKQKIIELLDDLGYLYKNVWHDNWIAVPNKK